MTKERTLSDYMDSSGAAQVATESNETIEEDSEERDTASTSTSVVVERAEKQRVAGEIGEWVDDARRLARELDLDPYHVNYWIVGNEEMNRLATYGGFQHRYPHWRWGMQYDRQRKKDQYFGGRIFEMVNNDDPAHAFLQMSNSEADQKSVVTHVEAHADFFKNNQWFRDSPNAAKMLSQHADRIEEIMERPDVSRNDVEKLIDTVTCIEDTIDQTQTLLDADPLQVDKRRDEAATSLSDLSERIKDLDVSESIREQIFDEEWIEEHEGDDDETYYADVVGYIMRHGHRFDEETESAREFEDWESEVIRMLRDEMYYFAPQKMTKVMNEGWASYWETAMMAWEGFAGDDEFVEYSDHHSKVLEAPGLNPYKLGRELWIHVENRANRREVVDKLLRIKGVTPSNFKRKVDFDAVRDALDSPDAYSPATRNFSLIRPENRGFIEEIEFDELEEIYRYVVDYDKYDSIEDAISDVDYGAGWARMREIRETNIDVTFIDEFLDEDFVRDRGYFTWDYNPRRGRKEVSQTDPASVKKKLLLQFSNFGKPTVVVEDGNYNNSGELLLTHKYNGIQMDLEQAGKVIERLSDVWGRAVHLKTIGRDADGSEEGVRIYFDPIEHDEPHVDKLPRSEYEHLLPDEIDDYSTAPDSWFQ